MAFAFARIESPRERARFHPEPQVSAQLLPARPTSTLDNPTESSHHILSHRNVQLHHIHHPNRGRQILLRDRDDDPRHRSDAPSGSCRPHSVLHARARVLRDRRDCALVRNWASETGDLPECPMPVYVYAQGRPVYAGHVQSFTNFGASKELMESYGPAPQGLLAHPESVLKTATYDDFAIAFARNAEPAALAIATCNSIHRKAKPASRFLAAANSAKIASHRGAQGGRD
ncbi:hypothetical protein BDK51DRAFT_44375 [Blyttiomyces helicus]|uniref:Uncharacterized protein n=1 Tax=Blyttiomyces helicus TaxID=388810 RepID=A0A4P9WKR6_9FUNG|nr:hypothetical protein BDK51DRAFT_44375 [Blyttiomyces helicus]|eukprot:RKO91770.1 hypothetical protein BDK51DRAFT_44375 [Blyttiomyces helicus]